MSTYLALRPLVILIVIARDIHKRRTNTTASIEQDTGAISCRQRRVFDRTGLEIAPASRQLQYLRMPNTARRTSLAQTACQCLTMQIKTYAYTAPQAQHKHQKGDSQP